MPRAISGAIVRLHGPLNLRLWDRLTIAVGLAFIFLALPLMTGDRVLPAMVAFAGGCLIVGHCQRLRRRHEAHVWAMAAIDADPIESLVLHEYLYRLRFRDVCAIAEWRTARDAAGLPLDDLDAPPPVRQLFEYLRAVSPEG